MFIRLNLSIFLMIYAISVGATQIVLDKHNIAQADITPPYVTDGRQVYLLEIDQSTNQINAKQQLFDVTGQNVTFITNSLVRIELFEDKITKKLLEKILDIPGIKKLYPNVKLSLEPRGIVGKQETNNTQTLNTNISILKNAASRNDYEYQGQWALENIETGIDVGATTAWQVTSGLDDGVIAIFGGSIDTTHEDLVDSFWINSLEIPDNEIDDDQNGYIDDIHGINVFSDNGHIVSQSSAENTGLAGIISATQDNTLGISGLTKNDKILTCYMSEYGFETTIDEIAKCFAYVIDLKENRNVNIHSILLTWGIISAYEDAYPWLRTLVDSLIPYDIFIIVPVRICEFACTNIDRFPDLPASYDSPHILAVTSINKNNILDSGVPHSNVNASYGYRTIHTSAPGAQILTTLPGYLPDFNKDNSIFFDSFETETLDNWESIGADYSFTSDRNYNGIGALVVQNVDDTGSSSNEEVMVSRPMDLHIYRGQSLVFTYQFFFINEQIEEITIAPTMIDLIYGDGSIEMIGNLQTVKSPYWRKHLLPIHPLSFGNEPLNEKTDEQLKNVRIRLRTNNVNSAIEKLYFDDFALGVLSESDYSNKYNFLNGTTPAGAHVAASISLIKQAQPELTVSQIKNLIITTGTKQDDFFIEQKGTQKPYFTLNNKSLKIASNDGNSVLNCNNQQLTHRVYPKQSGDGAFVAVTGSAEKLAVYNINCSEPAGSPTVLFEGNNIQMHDDGLGLDTANKDGIYTSELTINQLGDSIIEIEDDEYGDLTYRTFSPYLKPVKVDYEWEIPDGGPVNQTAFGHVPPFPINIGNIKDDHQLNSNPFSFMVSIKGYLYIDYLTLSDRNPWIESKNKSVLITQNTNAEDKIELKAQSSQFFPLLTNEWRMIIAPFARNAYTVDISKQQILDFVVGESPNRKWVVEWSNGREWNCTEQEEQVFQAVFNEANGEIQFNYKSVGTTCEDITPGIGIQIGKTFNTFYPDLIEDRTSLRVALPHNNYLEINQIPRVTTQIQPVYLEQYEYTEILLDDYFLDDKQETLTYKLYYDDSETLEVLIDGIYFEGNKLIINSRTITEIKRLYITATDIEGLKATGSFYIQITGEYPRRIKPFENVKLFVNEEKEFNLTEYFTDNLDINLNYEIDLATENYVLQDNILRVAFSSEGSYNFTLTATDLDGLSTPMNGYIEVIQNSPPYVALTLGTITVEIGQAFSIDLQSHFKDAEDSALTYTTSGLPSGITLENSKLTGSIDTAGSYNYSITATDSFSAFVTSNGTINVNAPVLPPTQPQSSGSGGGGVFDFRIMLILLMIYVYFRRRYPTLEDSE